MAAPSAFEPKTYPGEYIHSISASGEWMVSEIEDGSGLIIRNLLSGEDWTYASPGYDGVVGYGLGTTRDVSNDGTVIGEVFDVPSYWKNGKWTELPGASGLMAAMVGAITPDASIIVGSLSGTNSRTTRPCLWYLQEDGTYGQPVFLPNPGSNFWGGVQYANGTSISDDGTVVGVSVKTGNGLHSVPYVYTRNDRGSWTNRALGEELINPLGLEIPRQPSDLNPQYPNYEAYMTPEEIAEFNEASGAWIDEQYAKGLNTEEIIILSYLYAAEFMTPENAAKYKPLAERLVDTYYKWVKAYDEYIAAMEALANSGIEFEFNNVFVSPDGKYLYASGFKSVVVDPTSPEYGIEEYFAPTRFDVETGKGIAYSFDDNVIISCVTADNCVLGQTYSTDVYLYKQAYIYPDGVTEGLPLQDYFLQQGKTAVYDWMEQTVYQEVFTGVTELGSYVYDDFWSVGKPVASYDMGVVGFGFSTLYWFLPFDPSVIFVTAVMNTDMEPDEGENGDTTGISDADVLDILSTEIVDMSGKTVYFGEGNSLPVLSPGVYVIKTTTSNGISTNKIIY